MTTDPQRACTVFCRNRLIATGPLIEVLLRAKAAFDRDRGDYPIIFDDGSGEVIETNLLGTDAEMLAGIAPDAPAEADGRRAGRPKLGVVAREVTLLPRHWDWLAGQPEGASAALRKLVEEARRDLSGKDRARRSQRAADKVMRRLGGDLPLFEDAYRAFNAGDDDRMGQLIAAWPSDIRDYLHRLAATARRHAAEIASSEKSTT